MAEEGTVEEGIGTATVVGTAEEGRGPGGSPPPPAAATTGTAPAPAAVQEGTVVDTAVTPVARTAAEEEGTTTAAPTTATAATAIRTAPPPAVRSTLAGRGLPSRRGGRGRGARLGGTRGRGAGRGALLGSSRRLLGGGRSRLTRRSMSGERQEQGDHRRSKNSVKLYHQKTNSTLLFSKSMSKSCLSASKPSS